jgi:hypothetical protein
MQMRNFVRLAVIIPIWVTAAVAQWTPVTSRIRETTETLRSGNAVEKQVKEGMYLRLDDGSTLVRWTSVNGVEKPGTGNLHNNSTLHSYVLDYGAKIARQSRFDLPKPLSPDLYAQSTSLGEDKVAGLPCKLIPVDYQYMDDPVRHIGQACVSVKYGLLLKQETKVNSRDGAATTHVLTEMYDVRLGAEPDPKEFDVDGTFEVSKPSEVSVPPNR